jgi:hypothetical protein
MAFMGKYQLYAQSDADEMLLEGQPIEYLERIPQLVHFQEIMQQLSKNTGASITDSRASLCWQKHWECMVNVIANMIS